MSVEVMLHRAKYYAKRGLTGRIAWLLMDAVDCRHEAELFVAQERDELTVWRSS